MKVDLVCFSGASGLGDYTISLAKELDKIEGIDVRVITSNQMKGAIASQFYNVFFIFRRTRNLITDYWRYVFDTLKYRPDVVIFQSCIKIPLIDALIVRFLRLNGIVCLTTVHDVLPHVPRFWSKAEFWIFYRAFDGLIAHSQGAKDTLIGMGVTSPVCVAPHGVYDIFNTKKIDKNTARKKFQNINENDYLVLFFGHIEERKGVIPLLDAVELLSNEKNVKFLMAGKSKMNKIGQERLKIATENPNFMLHNKYIGFEEVQNYFAACDVVIMPYLEGTTSGVLKLAIAFRKPVLATDVGDAKVTIENSGTDKIGKVINLDDLPSAIASGIREIALDKEHFDAALNAAYELYSWNNVSKIYFSYIESHVQK